MNDPQFDHWIAQWQQEADKLFRYFEIIPPELRLDLQHLRAWGSEAERLIQKYEQVRVEMAIKRQARAEAEARINAIVERQRIATELEWAERELRRFRAKIEALKARIDQVTDKVIREMVARKRRALEDQAHFDAALRLQAEEDLRMWEAFKQRLDAPPSAPSQPLPSEDPMSLDALLQQQAQQERLRQEYERYQAKPIPTRDDDEAAWAEFTQQISPPKKKR
jgi:hypothetical protein